MIRRGARWLPLAAALAIGGACFTDLRDRDCAGADDCFDGEACTSGRCVAVVQGPAAPSGEVAVSVEARAGDAPDEARAATIDADGDDTVCGCHEPAGTPCEFTVEGGAAQTFCASLPGYVPCAVTVRGAEVREGARFTLYLDRCPDGEDCVRAAACDCEGLPACVEGD